MLMTILNVVYVLVALAMVGLILMQRGAGAQAGSGFGGGASSTVFGARGSSNFLSKSTKWLAIVFFGISLGMAWYATRNATDNQAAGKDLGVMAQGPAAPATGAAVPAAPAQTAPQGMVPAAPQTPMPSAPQDSVPAAPAPAATPAQSPAQPAPANGASGN